MTPPVPGDKDIFIEAHGDGWERMFCAVTRDDCDRDVALANAKLVAAAPEMLDALWSLMVAYGATDGRNGNSGECWDKARAVLAKISPERPVR